VVATSKETATNKNPKAGEVEAAAEAVAEVMVVVSVETEETEVEEATIEVADKITETMEAHLGAEVLAPEAAMAAVKVVATNNLKVVVASDQRLLVLQVAVHQWSRRVVDQEQWFTFPISDSKLTNRT
jgi:hypothetical protein